MRTLVRVAPFAGVLWLLPVTAAAQSSSSPGTAPPDGVFRRVPTVSVRAGAGQIRAGSIVPQSATSISAGIIVALGRYFAFDGSVVRFKGRQTRDVPGFSFTYSDGTNRTVTIGPYAQVETTDTLIGAGQLLARIDRGRVTAWAGAGFAVGTDRGESFRIMTTCSAPQVPGYCDQFDSRWQQGPIRVPVVSGGLDLAVNNQLGVFARFESISGVSGGVRIAVATRDDVTPARLHRPAVSGPARAIDLTRGETVWVTTADGSVRRGRLVSLSPSTLELFEKDRVVSMPFSNVRRLEKGDSLRNGALLGSVIGFGGMLMYASAYGYFGGGDESPAFAAGLGIAATGIGFGALGGAAIDALIEGRTEVYRSASGATASIRPILEARRLGARLAFQW